jgi:hypothetical protein
VTTSAAAFLAVTLVVLAGAVAELIMLAAEEVLADMERGMPFV